MIGQDRKRWRLLAGLVAILVPVALPAQQQPAPAARQQRAGAAQPAPAPVAAQPAPASGAAQPVPGPAATQPAPATRITFEAPGAEDGLLDALRAASLLANAESNAISDPQELMAAALSDYARLLGALYEQGHYGSVINILMDGREAAEVSTLNPPARIGRVVVRVAPGPVFDFRTARIAPLPPGAVLPPGFAPGRRAQSPLIQQAVAASRLAWRNEGHAKVAVADQSITADHAASRLDVEVALSPGPEVTFGTLGVSGNVDVRTARIVAITGLPEGEVYSPDQMRDSARRLRRAGAFSSVSLQEADALGPGNSMDITAVVVEQLPRRFGFGAEADTSEGLGLSAYWMHRNLLGGAENLRFDAEITRIGSNIADVDTFEDGLNYSAGVTYTRPATISPDTDLAVSLLAEKKNERDYTTENLIFTAGLLHYFSDTLTGRLALQYGSYRVTEFGVEERIFDVLSLPTGLAWDGRDDRLNPRVGYFVDGEFAPFYGAASTGAGARLALDGRAYWTPALLNSRLTLAGRAQAATVAGPDLIDVPRDFLFYSGGGGTVRGQPYQSLGVPNPNFPQATIGGRSFLGLSGEVRVRATDAIGVVGFYDTGFVADDSFFGETGRQHSGAGLGVRYNTGIGPIRLDVGVPVQGNTGEGVQIYVGIGQAF